MLLLERPASCMHGRMLVQQAGLLRTESLGQKGQPGLALAGHAPYCPSRPVKTGSELLLHLETPVLARRAPLRLRTGVLLYGPPGCGKTHVVAAAAAACQLRLISVKGPEVLNKYIGASEAAVRDLFRYSTADLQQKVPVLMPASGTRLVKHSFLCFLALKHQNPCTVTAHAANSVSEEQLG